MVTQTSHGRTSVVIATAVTVFIVMTALGVWVVGLGRFGEDYCLASARDGESVSSPEWKPWESPLEVECDYGVTGSRTQRESFPLIWTLAVLGGAVVLVAGTWLTTAAVRSLQGAAIEWSAAGVAGVAASVALLVIAASAVVLSPSL